MTRRDLFLALAVQMLWAFGIVLAKDVVTGSFPPVLFLLLVYAGVWILLRLSRQKGQTPFAWASLFAAFHISIQGVFTFLGVRLLDASTAMLLMQISAPAGMLASWAMGGERPRLLAWIGLGLALLGVAAIVGLPQRPPPLLGCLFVLTGACVWAIGQSLVQRLGRESGPALLERTALASLPQLLLLVLVMERPEAVAALGAASLQQWLGLGLVIVTGFWGGYWLWFLLLTRVPMARLMPFTLLVPVLGLLLAIALRGERPEAAALAGGALIIIGLAISQARGTRITLGLRRPAV